MKQGVCPKCHSENIVPDVTMVDYNRHQFASTTQLVFERNPDAIVFKDRIYSAISAWVCGNCGYVELYTTNHHALLEAYQERLAYTEVGDKLVPNAPAADVCRNCGKGLKAGDEKCPNCGKARG